LGADDLIDDIHNYASQLAPNATVWARTFGSSGLGLDLTLEAWPTLHQTFRSETTGVTSDTPGRDECLELPNVERLPLDVLRRHPVDVLVLGDLTDVRSIEWLTRVEQGLPRPRMVFEL
jgi:hypothetical protein